MVVTKILYGKDSLGVYSIIKNTIDNTVEWFGLYNGERFCCKQYLDNNGYRQGYFNDIGEKGLSESNFKKAISLLDRFSQEFLNSDVKQIIK